MIIQRKISNLKKEIERKRDMMAMVSYWILEEHIKRETEKAYLLECPNKAEYSRMQYWVSKSNVRKFNVGNFFYYQVLLPMGMEVKMSRFRGKNRPKDYMDIVTDHLASLYYNIPNRIQMRVEFERRAMQADIEFEQRMRSANYSGHNFQL